jgi:hypothetical protein
LGIEDTPEVTVAHQFDEQHRKALQACPTYPAFRGGEPTTFWADVLGHSP